MHDHQVGGKSLEDINAKLSFNVVGISTFSISVADLFDVCVSGKYFTFQKIDLIEICNLHYKISQNLKSVKSSLWKLADEPHCSLKYRVFHNLSTTQE